MKNRALPVRSCTERNNNNASAGGKGGGACCTIDIWQHDYTKSVGPQETPHGWSCRATRERKSPFYMGEVLGKWRLLCYGDFHTEFKLKRKALWSPRIFNAKQFSFITLKIWWNTFIKNITKLLEGQIKLQIQFKIKELKICITLLNIGSFSEFTGIICVFG